MTKLVDDHCREMKILKAKCQNNQVLLNGLVLKWAAAGD